MAMQRYLSPFVVVFFFLRDAAADEDRCTTVVALLARTVNEQTLPPIYSVNVALLVRQSR